MRKLYNVSYDLNKADKDYKGLHDELKRTFEWYHLLDSTWLLYTSESADQIWQRLKSHVDTNDNLLIVQITSNRQGWLPEKAWQWLKSRDSQIV